MTENNRSIRRWHILVVDDVFGANNVVVRQAAEYLGATTRRIRGLHPGVADAGEGVSGKLEDDYTNPFPLISFIHEEVGTLPSAWHYVSQINRAMDLPDLALLDIRMDGIEGGPSPYQQHGRREIKDIDTSAEAYMDLLALKEMVLSLVDDRIEAERKYAESREPAVFDKEFQRKHLAESDIRAETQTTDLFSTFESLAKFREEIESEINCSAAEVEGKSRKLGFLSRGGIFVGELLRARAKALNADEPIIIYYSGSRTARSAMLPPVLVGREEVFSKGDFSLMPFVSSRLEQRAKELVLRRVVSHNQKEVLRYASAVIRDDSLLSEKETTRLLCEEALWADDSGRSWTIAGLFPGSVCWALGNLVFSQKIVQRGPRKRGQLAEELQALVPDTGAGTRQVLTSQMWAGVFHFGEVLGLTYGNRFDEWRGDLGAKALERSDWQSFKDWATLNCKRMALEMRGIFAKENSEEGEGIASKSAESISAELLNRFMAFFESAQGAPAANLSTMISRYWKFKDSSWLRTDVLKILQDIINSSEQPRFRAIPGRLEGFLVDDGELSRHKGPVYWFCLTESFERFVTDSAAGEPSESVKDLLKDFVTDFSALLDGLVWVAWESKEDGTGKGHELGRILLFGDAGAELPIDLLSDKTLGDTSAALFARIKRIKHTIGVRYFHRETGRRCREARDGDFKLMESNPPVFPEDTAACWEFRLPVYLKGVR